VVTLQALTERDPPPESVLDRGPRSARHRDADILVVDDDGAHVELVATILERAGYREVRGCTDPWQALERCLRTPPDLLVLDLRMPGLDGVELLERLEDDVEDFSLRPVLVLTSDSSREARRHVLSRGGRDFITKPASPSEVRLRVANLLETRFLHLALQDQNARLEERVLERTADLEAARIETLERLALAAEWRDDATGQHTRRVGLLASRLARALGLGDEETELIGRAAPLHDVGKIGIHDAILLKPGPLDRREMATMQEHTTIGARILSGSRIPSLMAAEEIARHHHEDWNGAGYPAGLSGESIPIRARIVAIADVFDSLAHARVYKPAWPVETVLRAIRGAAGTKFDPEMVRAFLSLDPVRPSP